MLIVARLRIQAIVLLRKVLRRMSAVRLLRYPSLRDLLDRFAQSKSAAVDLADAIGLYEHIVRLRPRAILELGPGTSTNIICLAIDDIRKSDVTYSPTFLSFEENAEWLQFHEETFIPSLRKYVTLAFLPAAKKDSDVLGESVAHYASIPLLPYEFVFIDGPDFLRFGCNWSSDVVDLADTFGKKVSIVFDNREHTVRETWKRLKPKGFKLKRNFYSLCYEICRE
jgi:hypothetical protein